MLCSIGLSRRDTAAYSPRTSSVSFHALYVIKQDIGLTAVRISLPIKGEQSGEAGLFYEARTSCTEYSLRVS